MAKARIGKSGLSVKLSLSFNEAAALHALLLRVGHETNRMISEETLSLFGALDEVRDDIQEQDFHLWPTEFQEFGQRHSALVDEDKEEED